MSPKQIAVECGTTIATVYKWIKRLGLPLARGKAGNTYNKRDAGRIIKAINNRTV